MILLLQYGILKVYHPYSLNAVSSLRNDFVIYKVELKMGTHHGKTTPMVGTKWKPTEKESYKSLSVPYRYKLQHHLSYAYGRKFAKTIMQYVYDYLRQGCDIYAWWKWGKCTQLFAQNDRCFFCLSIQPVQRK